MERNRLFALGAFIILAGVALGGSVLMEDSPFAASPGGKQEAGAANWTVFFYFCGDNNLAEYNQMVTNVEFLMKVPPSDRVNLLVLLDRDGASDTVAFTLEGSERTDVPLSDISPDWGDELNLGDPDTLVSFVRWGVLNYPAVHYNVMLSNHGGGWRGICWDDGSDGDNLDLPELKEAFAEIKEIMGHNVDVLSTEACLVAMVEFAYQIRESVDLYVGSETYGYGGENTTDGGLLVGNWQFDKVWGALCAHPEMSPEDLALTMVENFQIYGPWRGGWYIPKKESSDTMSVMRLEAMDEVVNASSALAQGLASQLTGPGSSVGRLAVKNAIGSPEYLAREYTESFSGQLDHIGLGSYTNYDLYDFALQVSGTTLGLAAEAQAVMDAVENAVLAEVHGTNTGDGEHPDAHGISVYIPQTANEYNDNYDLTDFAADSFWDEFIKAYFLL